MTLMTLRCRTCPHNREREIISICIILDTKIYFCRRIEYLVHFWVVLSFTGELPHKIFIYGVEAMHVMEYW